MTAVRRVPRLPRGAVVALGIAGAVLVAALAGGPPHREGPPLDPRSDGPRGTSALVALLRRLDAEVSLSAGLPDGGDDVALVLQDRLDSEQRAEVRAWAVAGGTLVVTDPGSPLVPLPTAADLPRGAEGTVEPGRCTIDALAGIGPVDAGAPVAYETGEADGVCFAVGDGAFVVARTVGSGELVAVGGAAFVTNDLLDEVDNAVLAAALLAPQRGSRVRVVEAPLPAGGGSKTLADLVPARVVRALLQLAVAFAIYALWRAIRLGRPVVEEQPVEVAGSELVGAVGRLLSHAHAPGAAAETLRTDLRRTLRARFGVGPEVDAATLAALVADRTGLDVDPVLAAIDDRPITSDEQLAALARAVASVHQEVPR